MHMNLQTKLLGKALLCVVVFIAIGMAETRKITGQYRNPAEGFAVTIPNGAVAVTGDQAGPERGFRITTPSGGSISVYEEPNSLEWNTQEDGIRNELDDELDHRKCGSAKYTITPARIGHLIGAEGRLNCADRSFRVLLVFRPKDGLIYWMWLETAADKAAEDGRTLERLAATFKVITRK
jgi:hypothetical protein